MDIVRSPGSGLDLMNCAVGYELTTDLSSQLEITPSKNASEPESCSV